ncbi:cell division protein FtsA [Thermoflexus hugenholtzii]|jgi:cell division protein FtsA|uniref:Cell division protein FtsA n=1 Tax=Thermoflexus hugenholtzii JAD2 TaxID=877466 RepID=A0A212QVR3_9CHLR|nr:cell division protein FtsA [Thermoflexus hugenholtzii]SNB63820.1 cell division protein FtsA [Thermoflexus hugenholtzii JAD2]
MTLVAMDIGSSKICTLVGEADEAGVLRILGVGVVPARGIRRGVVVNIAEATDAIRASVERAERTSGYQIRRAIVGIAGPYVASVNSKGTASVLRGERGITPADVQRAVENARVIAIPHSREILHVLPRAFTVDGQEGIRDPIGMYGFRLEAEVHIVTAEVGPLANLRRCIESAQIEVEEFVLSPLASAEAVITEGEREMGVALVDIGAGTTDLAVFVEGSVAYTTVIPVGGQHITNDLAYGLHVPAPVAEEIKIRHGHALAAAIPAEEQITVQGFGDNGPVTFSRREMAEIIEARVQEIFQLVLGELRKSGYERLLPAGLVLCGGTALLPGIREVAREHTEMPVRIGMPWDLGGLAETLRSPAFATAVGLLRWGLRADAAAAYAASEGSWWARLWQAVRGILREILPG